MSKAVPAFVALIAGLALAVTCSQGGQEASRALDACVERGVTYFRDAGLSVMSDGRTPRRTAEDRCLQSLGAFG